MIIEEAHTFRAEIIQKIEQREFKERVGVHCSDLCYCLNKQALRKFKPMPTDEHEILLFSLGWATQRWLTGANEDEPEIEVDGIKVTKDALKVESGDEGTNFYVPWELKCTYKSADKPIDDEDSWLKQIMAQCHVSGVPIAYLSRFELMGNWKSVFGKKEEKSLPANQKPTIHVWRLCFTQDELTDNWEWLKSRRDLFLQLLETEVLLPSGLALPVNHDWECNYCKYKENYCIR